MRPIPNSSWQGNGIYEIRVETNPVPLHDLLEEFNFFSPSPRLPHRPGDLEKADPEAWLLRVTAPSSLRNLWVVASDRFRSKLENAHQSTVVGCFRHLELSLPDPRANGSMVEMPGLLFATVQLDPATQGVPSLETEAFMPNRHFCLDGEGRCRIYADELHNWDAKLTDFYWRMLCECLRDTLGLDVVRERDCEPRIVGVPESLVFSESQADKRPRTLATLRQTPEVLKFEDWQDQAARQGWGKGDAEALLEQASRRVSDPLISDTRAKTERSRSKDSATNASPEEQTANETKKQKTTITF